jgi:hypothetical protein
MACSDSEDNVEKIEQQATQIAIQNAKKNIQVELEIKQQVVATEQTIDDGNTTVSNTPAEIFFQWKDISALHQSFFTDESVTTVLTNGLTQLPSPVPIEIRWKKTSVAGDLGVGEIVLIYEKNITVLEELQSVSDVLLKYRNEVGNLFDMRILSFNIAIENNDCRVDVLSKVSMNTAPISPCIVKADKSYCAEVSNEGRAYSKKVKDVISSCFPK